MKKMIVCMIFAVMCFAVITANAQPKLVAAEDQMPVNQDARLILPVAEQQKNIDLAKVKAIKLYDLEGQLVKAYDESEFHKIIAAYNGSMIDDTSYIEMIAGNRMVITLDNDAQVNIHSYGNETYVVASNDTATYHLIAPEIAKILLDKNN